MSGARVFVVVLLLGVGLASVARPAAAQPAAAAAALQRAEHLREQGTAASLAASVPEYEAALRAALDAADPAAEAAALTGLGRAKDALGDKRGAIALFERALPLHEAAGDSSAASYTLNYLALAHDFLGERNESVRLLDQALVAARAAHDRRAEGVTLGNEGLLQQNLGNRRGALDFYQQALAVHREVGNVRGQATTLTNIGTTYDALGDKPQAIAYLEQALPLRREIGDPREEAATLNNLALVYFTMDRPDDALERYGQALDKWHQAGDRSGEGATLHNIASIEEARAEYQQALDHYGQALALFTATGYRAGQGNTLNNMGSLYSKLGDHARAVELYTRALAVHRAVGNRSSEASTLSNLGAEQFLAGDRPAAAASFDAALPLWEATGDIGGQARSLVALSRVRSATGDFDGAAGAATNARDLAKRAGSRRVEALATAALADTAARRGHPEAALRLYEQALDAEREIADGPAEAATLLGLARVERRLGRLDDAGQHANRAIDLVETFRTAVASPDLRMSYFASVQDYFETAIGALMDLQAAHPDTGRWATAAFEMSERARARSFVDLLTEARLDVRAGVDAALLAKERALNARLSARAERQTRLLSGTHTAAQAAALNDEIAALLAERQQIEAQILEASPRYATLSRSVPLSSEAVRASLGADTVLVEIAEGTDRSYAFLVRRDSIHAYALPAGRVLDRAADAFFRAAESPSGQSGAAGRRLAALLLTPLRDELASRSGGSRRAASPERRLAFIASGDLQYVPFAALPDPITGRPLVASHEIVALPSAAVLQTLRAGRAPRARANTALLVVADPVFSADDPRVEPTRGQPPRPGTDAAPAALTRSLDLLAEGGRGAGLPRLVGSRREAAAIRAVLPNGSVTEALDFDASRDRLASGLDRYGILHFATHALLNSEHPELSGIVLSLVDRDGSPRNGYVGMAEILNLKLHADLVVLSACQTALGPSVKGEGLLALSRAFIYAGTPRVVATTWKVDDAATAALMQRFYQEMFGAAHRPPAAALRAAQLYVRSQPRWRAPYYWAPFILEGDWR